MLISVVKYEIQIIKHVIFCEGKFAVLNYLFNFHIFEKKKFAFCKQQSDEIKISPKEITIPRKT